MLKLIDFLFYNFLLMNMLNVYSFKSPYPVIIQPQSGWSMEEWMRGDCLKTWSKYHRKMQSNLLSKFRNGRGRGMKIRCTIS